MSVTSEVGMKLTMYQSNNMEALITMKSKKYEPFVAKIKDFLFDEEDTKVVFQRSESTRQFPGEQDEDPCDTYTTYIKNVKSVGRHRA